MRRSWLTAASALAAVAAEASPASAQLFTTPATVDFGDTLVGSSSSKTFGMIVLGSISSGSVSAATAPFSGGPVSVGALMKADLPLTYLFEPAARGAVSESITARAINLGLKVQQSDTISLQGVGVAPVESVSTSSAPLVRIGTSGLVETVTISNVGDGNLSGLGDASDLLGSLSGLKGVFTGAGGSFDLADGAETSFGYSFAPTGHGAASASVTATFANGGADGTNQGGTQDVSLSGEGVGPQYSSNFSSGVIDLGTLALGSTASVDLKISNLSSDASDGLADLTDLSLLDASLSPGPFSLLKFIPDTILGEGESFDLKIDFSAAALGEQTADLVLTTDQDAAFGEMGETFDYRLTADVVPSPVPETRTWEMLLAGFGLLGLQYRRSQRSAGGGPSQGRRKER